MYGIFPFSLKGNLMLEDIECERDVSCIINFYGRVDLLEGILYSLVQQNYRRDRFEVILVEDWGGTSEGRRIAGKFGEKLDVRYFALPDNFGKMGFSRNWALSKSRGKYVLFLDDDTVILDEDFLLKMTEEFENNQVDAIIPFGDASFYLLKGRYGFHDPYFPSNRCMAYRREVLKDLCGFVSSITGQEDVEFVVRFIASGKHFTHSDRLSYLHPPLLINNLNKAAAVGISFFGLRNRYPLAIWIMLLVNGARYLPMLLLPLNTRWRMLGKFSAGFALGILYAFLGKKPEYR